MFVQIIDQNEQIPVKVGDTTFFVRRIDEAAELEIRLKHLQTGCYLHSHHFPAPLSKQQQASFFFRLLFMRLALSGQQFGRPIAGRREGDTVIQLGQRDE